MRSRSTASHLSALRASHRPAYAAELPALQPDYARCWDGLDKKFDPRKR